MSSYDFYNAGCSNVNDEAVHYCSDAVSIDKSNYAKGVTNVLGSVKPNESLSTYPSDSTNTGTNEGETPSPSPLPESSGYEGITQSDFAIEDDMYFPALAYPDMALPTEQKMVVEPEIGTNDIFTPTTDSFTGEEFTIECDFNKMETEGESIKEESVASKVPAQSQFKNKPKELLEKAVAIFKHIFGLNAAEAEDIVREIKKNNVEWAMDGDIISSMIEQLNIQEANGNDKQAKKTKKAILKKLEVKQYCCVSELSKFVSRIQENERCVIDNFSKVYKNKVSQAYFKNSEFEADEIFSWVLLHEIALAILPKSQETLQLLPLKKDSVFLSTWMFQSSMKEENKALYNGAYVRNHLRKTLSDAKDTLMQQAELKMNPERLALLKEVCGALAEEKEVPQRSERVVVSVVGRRATPVNCEFEGEMTGKRSSDLCSFKSEKITKNRK